MLPSHSTTRTAAYLRTQTAAAPLPFPSSLPFRSPPPPPSTVLAMDPLPTSPSASTRESPSPWIPPPPPRLRSPPPPLASYAHTTSSPRALSTRPRSTTSVSPPEMDVISIDFSHKLPFRLKLPMIKLALQRGIHFEIAYSPLIDDVNSRRQVLAEAKLLVDWTKGKNLIISSAAHNARGPYDVINLCAYLFGLSTQRAKAAMSVNCRSLISKATRKKYFYKETIKIDRLLPRKVYITPTTSQLGTENPHNFEVAHIIPITLLNQTESPLTPV